MPQHVQSNQILRYGEKYGAFAGLVGSFLYSLLIHIFLFVSHHLSLSTNNSLPLLPWIQSVLLWTYIGGIPAIVVGIVTGWLLGWSLMFNIPGLSSRTAWLWGIVCCTTIALLINIPTWRLFVDIVAVYQSEQGVRDISQVISVYSLILGIPSLCYIAIGGWISTKLYREVIG